MKFTKPEQATPEEVPDDGVAVELKYDGTRAKIIKEDGEVRIVNRSGADKTDTFSEITGENIPDNTILDGEIIVQDEKHPAGNLAKLLQRDNVSDDFKQKLLRRQMPAKFVAFDIERCSGVDMSELPYPIRRTKLVGAAKGDRVMVSKRFNDFSEAWNAVQDNGLEGVVVKKLDRGYPGKRTGDWMKVKHIKDRNVLVTDYEKHNKGVVAITDEGHRVNVNGAVSKDVVEALKDGSVKMEVSYLNETEDGNLREPRFKRLLRDG